MEKLKSQIGYGVACTHCDCGGLLVDSVRGVYVVFQKKEEAMKLVEQNDNLDEDAIVEVIIRKNEKS